MKVKLTASKGLSRKLYVRWLFQSATLLMQLSSFLLASFTIIVSIPLPHYPNAPRLCVFGDAYHDHVILVPHGKSIRLLNASRTPHLEATEFPTDDEQFPTALVAQMRLRAEETADAKWLRGNNWVGNLGWTIDLDPKFAGGESIQAVDMGLNGGIIAAVGSGGSLWIWMKCT